MQKNRLFIKITYPILVLVILMLLIALHYLHKDYRTKAYQVNTITSALAIVHAIEAYQLATANLPESLEDIAPKYIPFIYPAYWGNTGWIYKKQNEGFTLAVGYRESVSDNLPYPVIIYSSEDDHWVFND